MTFYIGKEPTIGNYAKMDSITAVNGQATYNLLKGGVAFAPQSANHVICSLNSIIQNPGSSFTISGSQIIFASNLQTGDSIDFILVLGDTLSIGVPSDDTIDSAKLKTNSVIEAKIQNNAVTTDKINNDAVTIDKINLISTTSAPSLEAKGTSGQTDGYIQLNCEQNSHGIKLKSPSHSSSQSYTIIMPDNQIAQDKFMKVKSITGSGSTAVGQLEFADAGGGFVKLATTTITSPVASVNFDNTIVGGYNYYQIRMSNIGVSNDADDIGIKLSGDNGGSFGSIEATRAYPQSLENSGNYNVNSAGDYSYHLLTQDSEATESPDGISGAIVDIFNASSSSNHKHMISHSFTKNQNGSYYAYWTTSRNQLTDVVNYIRINNENNTLDSGTFTLYGIES